MHDRVCDEERFHNLQLCNVLCLQLPPSHSVPAGGTISGIPFPWAPPSPLRHVSTHTQYTTHPHSHTLPHLVQCLAWPPCLAVELVADLVGTRNKPAHHSINLGLNLRLASCSRHFDCAGSKEAGRQHTVQADVSEQAAQRHSHTLSDPTSWLMLPACFTRIHAAPSTHPPTNKLLPATVSLTNWPFSMARVTMLSMARPADLLLVPASRLTAATLLATSDTRPSTPATALLASLRVCTRWTRRGCVEEGQI